MKKLARSRRVPSTTVEVARETEKEVVLVFGWEGRRPKRWKCSLEHFRKFYFKIS